MQARRYAFARWRRRGRGDTTMNVAIQTERVAWHANRWNQLILGIIAMMAISSPQYVWTLFTGPHSPSCSGRSRC
jgi:hypothetical protein